MEQEVLEMLLASLLKTQRLANILLNINIILGVIGLILSVGAMVWLIRGKHENPN